MKLNEYLFQSFGAGPSSSHGGGGLFGGGLWNCAPASTSGGLFNKS